MHPFNSVGVIYLADATIPLCLCTTTSSELMRMTVEQELLRM